MRLMRRDENKVDKALSADPKHDPDPQGRVSAKGTRVFPRDKREEFTRRSRL
jgi:hypothetical protein